MNDLSLKNIIKSISSQQHFRDPVIIINKGSEAGNGFCGDIITVTVTEKTSRKKLNLIVKLSTGNKKMRESYSIGKMYENEINFYSNVYPKLVAFQIGTGVEQLFDSIPKFYASSLKNGHEYVIMENLKASNFELLNMKQALDHDHVRLIFSKYAKFHALSLAMKTKAPDDYLKIESSLPNVLGAILSADHSRYIAQGTFDTICDNLDSNIDSEFVEIVRDYQKNCVNTLLDILNSKEEYSCILHGDCWSNNMLFKYEHNEKGKCLTDMRIIDWQLNTIGSPVLDLSYALYSGASAEIFNNLSLYTDIYHDTLSTFLSELDCDVNEVFPKHTFREHWKKYAKFGMIMGFVLLKIKYTEKAVLVDNPLMNCEDGEEGAKAFTNLTCDVDSFMLRIRQILTHLKGMEAL